MGVCGFRFLLKRNDGDDVLLLKIMVMGVRVMVAVSAKNADLNIKAMFLDDLYIPYKVTILTFFAVLNV